MSCTRTLLFCIFSFKLFPPVQAQEGVILRSLQNASSIKVVPSQLQDQVWVLFQENCLACQRQSENLECLKGVASVNWVGVFSPEGELRKEARRFLSSFSVYYGDRFFLRDFEINDKRTPQILIFTKHQRYQLIGFRTCRSLSKYLVQNSS